MPPPDSTAPPDADILLYDGVCGLCNRFVRFILARDPAGRFRFASLQSGFAQALLARHGRDARDLDTVYVVTGRGGDERVLARSQAVIHVLARLGWPWRAGALAAPLPTRVLDAAYGLVARRRYRLFGKHDACPLPAPEWRDRFIDL
jgi:predicted DCC family thiol-disulfide oxidoreductase YuxK